MQHACVVHRLETTENWQEHTQQHGLFQITAGLIQVLSKVFALFILHHHIRGIVGLEETQHPHDIVVFKFGQRLCFV